MCGDSGTLCKKEHFQNSAISTLASICRSCFGIEGPSDFQSSHTNKRSLIGERQS